MAKTQILTVYDNRELSWLKFNERVLEEADDENVPLMEQALFESIFSSNLDEFFMVRVGSLIDSMLINDNKKDNKTKLRPSEQLSRIYKRVRELLEIKDKRVADTEEKLSQFGIRRVFPKQLSKKQSEFIENYYAYEIQPFINALVIDKRHPFPFLDGKKIYAALKLSSKNDATVGIISCSDRFDRVIFLPSQENTVEYILVEDVILHYAARQFTNYKTEEKTLLRITRSADITIEECRDDELDYRDCMSQMISRRKRLSPVRLQLSKPISDLFLSSLTDRLELTGKQVFVEKSPLDMSYVFALFKKTEDRRELYFNKLSPRRTPEVDPLIPMREQIEKGDILLSYPYESMEPFIRMLKEAAEDESVVSIKMTLYRVSSNSKIIQALCTAAENGKQVDVCVELRARFDEENNISRSKTLEEAGCRVMYGPPAIKVHSKLCLITRRFGDRISRITQIGTGNYNEKTAELYTDFSLMTANEQIAADAEAVFNALSVGLPVEKTECLLVSPLCLQNRVLELMDREINIANAGGDGYVGAKVNSLTDKKIIDKLIECSQAGVKVELVIRGISCLIAGVPGVTDNIRIVSIVGRFLEHSRIYIFGSGARQSVYISSADYMTRNTCRRIEVAAPLLEEAVKKRVYDYFKTQLNDNVKAREQQSDGKYIHVKNEDTPLDSQKSFYTQAYALEPNLNTEPAPETKPPKKGLLSRIIAFFRRR